MNCDYMPASQTHHSIFPGNSSCVENQDHPDRYRYTPITQDARLCEGIPEGGFEKYSTMIDPQSLDTGISY